METLEEYQARIGNTRDLTDLCGRSFGRGFDYADRIALPAEEQNVVRMRDLGTLSPYKDLGRGPNTRLSSGRRRSTIAPEMSD